MTSTATESQNQAARLSRRALIWRRFLRNRPAVFGLVVLIVVFIGAFIAPYFSPWNYYENDFDNLLMPPSREHWFGTTGTGIDVFAQTMRGLQKSLIIGILVALFSTSLSAFVGSVAGYLGGRIDRSLMWFVDLLLVLPSLLILSILSRYYQGKSWLLLVVLVEVFLERPMVVLAGLKSHQTMKFIT